MPHWLDKVITLLQADTADLRELAHIAGADPRFFYRGVKLENVDVTGQNIDGMEFSQQSDDEIHVEQPELELISENDARRPQYRAMSIKGSPRQEERAALLLSEFLKDRSNAMEIINSYAKDKAAVANSVIDLLREIHLSELTGKQFSNLQIARKVSGRFRRAEDKRAIVAYFFAKHLGAYPELREWLRGKSVGKLTRDQREEFYRLLDY